jgi:hypothetical protein
MMTDCNYIVDDGHNTIHNHLVVTCVFLTGDLFKKVIVNLILNPNLDWCIFIGYMLALVPAKRKNVSNL